jgi:hypothetical protein
MFFFSKDIAVRLVIKFINLNINSQRNYGMFMLIIIVYIRL